MAPPTNSRLFQPLKIGSLTLSNRLVLAPLTRFRASDTHVPTVPIVPQYYAQRACVPGTLLITEATFISARAGGYPNAPGIWSPEQLTAWRAVTDAVHAAGGHIYVQLWALGRAASADFLAASGHDVVSASDIPIPSDPGAASRGGSAVPRALTEQEIHAYIADYATAARNAVGPAGFDGVEIHAANGYLPDQFTQSTSNARTDAWGGSVPARSRFTVEIARACVAAVGADRVGIRLSPWSTFQGMRMPDPVPQFAHLLGELKALDGGRGLAYVHLVESRISGNADVETTEKINFATELWGDTSPVLIAGGYTPESALRLVDEERRDADVAVVFGRYWISNPDLVYRIKRGVELEKWDRDTFYVPKDPKGYVDFPFSESFEKEKQAGSDFLTVGA